METPVPGKSEMLADSAPERHDNRMTRRRVDPTVAAISNAKTTVAAGSWSCTTTTIAAATRYKAMAADDFRNGMSSVGPEPVPDQEWVAVEREGRELFVQLTADLGPGWSIEWDCFR